LSDNNVKKVGVIVGREWSWPPAFIEEVNRRDAGVIAEFAKLGGTTMNEPNPYAVIVDRISHEIPYYRAYLKNAVLQGTVVINNPFWWSADDKYTGASIADKLGIPHPKTVALPSHSYVEGVVQESLRNLQYPIPWEQHIEYVGGFPVILKPAWGGGFKKVYKLNNFEELFRAYNETGTECMMLQQYIEWDKYARCVCIGQNDILTIKFDANAPWPHRYFVDHDFLTPDEGRQVTEGALKLNQALGYDMNTVEFAVKDGVAYAIDFTNPAPDFDVVSLTEHYFPWVVNKMADLVIDLALGKRQQQRIEYRWDYLLQAGMQPLGQNGGGASSAQPSTATSADAKTSGSRALKAATSEASPAATEVTPPTKTRSRKAAATDSGATTPKTGRLRAQKSASETQIEGGSDEVQA
jgi:hypothetical protein